MKEIFKKRLWSIVGFVVVSTAMFANWLFRIADYESPFSLIFDAIMIAVLFFTVMQLLKWAVWVL